MKNGQKNSKNFVKDSDLKHHLEAKQGCHQMASGKGNEMGFSHILQFWKEIGVEG